MSREIAWVGVVFGVLVAAGPWLFLGIRGFRSRRHKGAPPAGETDSARGERDVASQADTSPPREISDRVVLLRERYEKGRAVQALSAGSAPASRHGAQAGKARRGEAVRRWANDTYWVLREHFSPWERDFCPYGVRWGWSDFFLAFDEELDEEMGGSAEAYLEAKLAFLAELLKKEDSASPDVRP